MIGFSQKPQVALLYRYTMAIAIQLLDLIIIIPRYYVQVILGKLIPLQSLLITDVMLIVLRGSLMDFLL